MTAPRIDPAGPDDIEPLLDLAKRFHGEEGRGLEAAGEAALRGIVSGEPLARCWIVRRADRPVGYLVLTLGFSVEYGGRDGFIDDLYLVESERGHGVGAALLEFAIGAAREFGIRTLHLEVDPLNEPASRLYRSRGFVENGRRLMLLPLLEEVTPP
jgi:GNAT superfamily N-acetyltransferase